MQSQKKILLDHMAQLSPNSNPLLFIKLLLYFIETKQVQSSGDTAVRAKSKSLRLCDWEFLEKEIDAKLKFS